MVPPPPHHTCRHNGSCSTLPRPPCTCACMHVQVLHITGPQTHCTCTCTPTSTSCTCIPAHACMHACAGAFVRAATYSQGPAPRQNYESTCPCSLARTLTPAMSPPHRCPQRPLHHLPMPAWPPCRQHRGCPRDMCVCLCVCVCVRVGTLDRDMRRGDTAAGTRLPPHCASGTPCLHAGPACRRQHARMRWTVAEAAPSSCLCTHRIEPVTTRGRCNET